MEIEGNYHNVYVIKRPGVDQFMKRVGELYEVVVFTASVSKVCEKFVSLKQKQAADSSHSTVILSSTNWTFTRSSTIAFSARVATTTRATTSRICPRLVATSRTPLSSTTHPLRTSSIPSIPCQLAVGSRMLTIMSCSTSSRFSKTLLALTYKTSAWSLMSLFEALFFFLFYIQPQISLSLAHSHYY